MLIRFPQGPASFGPVAPWKAMGVPRHRFKSHIVTSWPRDLRCRAGVEAEAACRQDSFVLAIQANVTSQKALATPPPRSPTYCHCPLSCWPFRAMTTRADDYLVCFPSFYHVFPPDCNFNEGSTHGSHPPLGLPAPRTVPGRLWCSEDTVNWMKPKNLNDHSVKCSHLPSLNRCGG